MRISSPFKKLLLVIPAVLLITMSLEAGETRILEGRSLLEAFRYMHGRSAQASYEKRKQMEKEAQEMAQEVVPAIESEIAEEVQAVTEEMETVESLDIPEIQIPETVMQTATEEVTIPAETETTAMISSDKLLSMMPPESILAIRINGFQNNISKLDQYLTGVLPIPLAASMLTRSNLSGLLGSPDLKGIDLFGNFGVFMVKPETTIGATRPTSTIFVLIPVSNYSLFVSGNQNVSEPDEQGISTIISQAAPPMVVQQTGDFALVTPGADKSLLIETASKITETGRSDISTELNNNQIQAAETDSLWAYLNTQALPEDVNGIISSQLTAAAQMSGGAMPGAGAPDIGAVLDGLQFISISANPEADVLNLTINTAAVEGSETTQSLQADSPAMTAFLQTLNAKSPADAGDVMPQISALIPGAAGADFVGTLNLLNAAASAAAAAGQPIGEIPQATSSLAFAVNVGDGGISVDIALPKEHLAEVVMTSMVLKGEPAEQTPDFTF